MNFKNFRIAMMNTILVASALLWLGCQNPSQGPKAAAPGAGMQLNDGTTDGGGGNGLNGRPLDSYIINPAELEAYKKHLAPMFETSEAKLSRTLLARDFFKFKNWYIADVKLKPIENDRLGLSFTDDYTQQMAIQTSRAIWINASIFEKMDSEEQAKLILHEYVMNMYFFKFKKYSEICKLYASVNPAQVTCYDSIDEIYLPTKEEPLTVHDYENIRGMTSWLWSNWKTSTDEDVARELIRYDFDKRTLVSLFKKNDHQNEDSQAVPVTTVTSLIDKAILLNKAPTECRGLNTQEVVACTLELQSTKFTVSVGELPGVKIIARSSDGRVLFEEGAHTVGNSYISKFEDTVTGKHFFLVPLSSPSLGEVVKGQKFRNNFLILTAPNLFEKEIQYELFGIVSIASVIVNVDSKPPAGPLEAFKNFNGLCWGERPRATSMADDVIAIMPPGTETAYFRWFANNIRGLSVPCKNGNTPPGTTTPAK